MCVFVYHIYIRISDRFQDRQRAIGVYQSVLNPPTSICDVTYWLNHLAQEKRKIEGYRGGNLAAINTAGENVKYSTVLYIYCTLMDHE